MRKTLTDKGVAALKPRPKRYTYPDPELRGHYVRVQPSGAKSFVVVARDPYGKQIWHTVDGCDALRIDDARDQAREARKRIMEGKPAVEPLPVKPDSFKDVAEKWLKRHVTANQLRTENAMRRALEKYVYPKWADRDFVSIKRSDVAAMLDHIEDNHGTRMADLTLAYMRGIANWFARRDDDYVSPFVRGMRRHTKSARERILTDDEIRQLWKQAEANGMFGAFLRVALLTGQRREKIAGMKWSDINGGTWSIPAEPREKGNAGDLVLPPVVLDIINAQPRIGNNPHVFAAARGNGPFRSFSRLKLAFDAALARNGKFEPWTVHDLRRTFRSLLSRCGVRPDIAEHCMGHSLKGVMKTYDRHAYTAEKADALKRLAVLIHAIVEPEENVVTMERAKRQ